MRLVRPSRPLSITVTGASGEAGVAFWDGGTTYALGDRAWVTVGELDDLVVNVYESQQNGNISHFPLDDDASAWWAYAGPSNPYKMFDDVAGSQTVADDDFIEATFLTSLLGNTIAVLNITNGTSVTVTVTAGGDTVYQKTQSMLIAGDGVGDWYEYFFGDIGRRNNALFTDLPSYAEQEITVRIDGETGLAVGTLSVGYGYFLGDTLRQGARIGITDYSRKQANAFGGFEVVERSFAKNGSFTFRVPNSRLEEIANLLPKYRAIAAIWIGEDDMGATYIYGFYKGWGIELTYANDSIATIDLEGLT